MRSVVCSAALAASEILAEERLAARVDPGETLQELLAIGWHGVVKDRVDEAVHPRGLGAGRAWRGRGVGNYEVGQSDHRIVLPRGEDARRPVLRRYGGIGHVRVGLLPCQRAQ